MYHVKHTPGDHDTLPIQSMDASTRQLGKLGEQVAAQWLAGRGYTVVDENYNKKWGELDLVALKDNHIYFCEIKTVQRRLDESGEVHGEEQYRPAENVHKAKMQRLHRAAQTWLEQHEAKDIGWQMDLITVRLDIQNKRAKVRRITCIS